MSKLLRSGVTGCAAILLAAMLTTPATARIECHGNFQMNKSGADRHALLRGGANRVRGTELSPAGRRHQKSCTTIPSPRSICVRPLAVKNSTVEGILRGLWTGLLRPRSLTVARTRGVMNYTPKITSVRVFAKALAQGGEGSHLVDLRRTNPRQCWSGLRSLRRGQGANSALGHQRTFPTLLGMSVFGRNETSRRDRQSVR